ncbi:hypothetical protein [Saccharomonospora piscinae]|uniref:hypothetical protein n=1 Tax=Saccharomonospora piscinae TaxID=687388 RepID=UPI0004676B4D|nr:hypothetical protein [Saccharomonospora piscinae]
MVIRRIGLLLSAALLAAGCGTVVEGTAESGDVAPLTSDIALGELAAVDFCSLFDEAHLAEGDRVEWTFPGMNFCTVWVETPATTAYVELGNLQRGQWVMPPDETTDLPRSVLLRRYEEDSQCVRTFLFDDGVSLEVSTSLDDDVEDAAAVRCRVAEAVTEGVRAAVYGERARLLPTPSGSLSGQRMCELMPVADVGELTGQELLQLEPPGGHRCAWATPMLESAYFVELELVSEIDDPHTAYPHTVGGRPTWVAEDTDGCLVTTPHTPLDDDPTVWEIVTVGAHVPDEDQCGPAKELAKEVWPRLPEFEG